MKQPGNTKERYKTWFKVKVHNDRENDYKYISNCMIQKGYSFISNCHYLNLEAWEQFMTQAYIQRKDMQKEVYVKTAVQVRKRESTQTAKYIIWTKSNR